MTKKLFTLAEMFLTIWPKTFSVSYLVTEDIFLSLWPLIFPNRAWNLFNTPVSFNLLSDRLAYSFKPHSVN